MVSLGVKRYRTEIQNASMGAHESTTPAGVQLIRASCARLIERLEIVFRDCQTGKATVYSKEAIQSLMMLPNDVTAFLALKGCVNHLSRPVKIIEVAKEIANFIEDEVRFRQFKSENPSLFGVITRDLSKKTTNYRRQKNVLVHSANKAGIEWFNWTPNTKVRIGTMLIEFICEETGLFKVEKVNIEGKKHKTNHMLITTPKAMEWIDQKNSICELLSPVKMPCIASPKRWTNIYEGGYHVFAGMHLVKSHDISYKKQLEGEDLSQVFRAVNTVQETAWKLNTKVFEVMDHLYSSQASSTVVPEYEERIIATKYPKGGTVEEQIKWKREASNIYSDNIKRKTKRVQFSQLMWMARKFMDEEQFYFPHTIDFRGRLYANTAFLNPQGEDSARGLLTFAKEKSLGESGLSWLAVHGSNCFGNDKVSLEDRYQWSFDHLEDIIRTANDPLDYDWWTTADKPWQFLAFCYDFKGAMSLDNPKKYKSSLPITVDGSCNGLQHFAAMLRDSDGGASVNLIPSDTPQDIYNIVRESVGRSILEDKEQPELAQLWNYGKDVNRSMVKRPVMTTPYGASKYGMRGQIHEELEKQLDKGVKFCYISKEDDYWKPSMYLAHKVYDAIGDVVLSAREGMQWLQSVARILAKEGKGLYWTMPTGFLVKQKYVKSKINKILTILNGKSSYLLASTFDSNKINSAKQVNGVAPNFVHSYDACHLMQTVTGAKDVHGIESFSVVHDSFGTHACDMEGLARVLRETFVDLYSEDVLQKFRQETQKMTDTELPPLPKYGSLNIKEVLESEFFFS